MLQTITFNGARLINARASFFRYEDGAAVGADASIRVRADGQDLGLFLPGDDVQLPVELSTWEIIPVAPACAGSVRVGVGKISSARLVGNVRIFEEINSNIQTTGNVSSLVNTAGVWAHVAVIAPAANVRGIVVRSITLSAQAGAGGNMYARISASPVAPATNSNGNIATLQNISSFGAFNEKDSHKVNTRVPPGWGIYHLWNIGGASALENGYSIGTELQ